MLFALRCIGTVNAAIWFGTAFFFCVVLDPSFASGEMLALLPQSHAGRAAQIVLERGFLLQYWSGGIALAHLLTEWLYTGKPLRPWTVYLVLGSFSVILVGGLWLQPKIKKLHLDLYGARSTPQQREQARRPLKVWQDVSQIMQYLVTLGLFVHLLQVTSSGGPPRFVGASKFSS